MTERRRALITGGNRGIGRAVGFELYRRNVDVVVTARDGKAAAATAAEIAPDVRSCALDVTDAGSVDRASTVVGQVDILVCNAGVLLDGGTDPLSVPLDLVDRTLAVNLLGAWRLAQVFVPDMVRRGWGRVVFVSSGTTTEFGGRLFVGAPGYSVSKAAVNGLMTMLAAQTAGSGVLVNAVNPGRARTRMMPAVTRLPEEAARDVADVAMAPDGSPTGEFVTAGRTPDRVG